MGRTILIDYHYTNCTVWYVLVTMPYVDSDDVDKTGTLYFMANFAGLCDVLMDGVLESSHSGCNIGPTNRMIWRHDHTSLPNAWVISN
ncbi:hypothetical protein BC827DRAFT_560949 [Russula dissimulans]|nr:hypothetical protein BC827DRAFT_560949 [Russula dissimulans]